MKLDYLNLSCSQDLTEKKEKIFYRLLEILPGFLSWLTILSFIFLSWWAPAVVAIFIIVFDIYWLVRVAYLSFHQIACFLEMKKSLKINWLEKLNNLKTFSLKIKSWQEIYHLVVLPMANEDLEIVKSTFEALINCQYPKEKMMVVLAIEERVGKKAQEIAKIIEEEFGKKFFKFLVTIHPQNIKGEVKGRGSNVAWAIKKAKESILKHLPPEKIIVSIFDIDTRPFPQYFAILTYHYLTTKKPLRSSYQPIPIYNNNIWEAPFFSRIVATANTFWQMMQQERREQLVTYSSHSMPLTALLEVQYPPNVVSDDSRIFWKAYLFYDGDYRVVPLYYPISMDAVLAKNFLQTVVAQYKQQKRWAWGVENIPYLLFGFWKNKKIALLKKISHAFIILEGFWSWATAALLIFSLGWLPLFLGGEKFNFTLLSYNLPRLTSRLMALAMHGMLIGAIISLLLLPPRPKNYSKLKTFSMFFQWFFLPLTLIFFGSFPALDAQTRLMIGKPLEFWVTEKKRKLNH